MDETTYNALTLIQDPYGNYVCAPVASPFQCTDKTSYRSSNISWILATIVLAMLPLVNHRQRVRTFCSEV
jgi:hypothetical protein